LPGDQRMTDTYLSTQPCVVAEQRTTHLPLYKVLLHNDDRNSMEHVVKSLMRVFKFEQRVCEQIMIEAHQNGLALCVIETLEQAEHHRDQLNSLSLISSIEPQ
jgi:ATP-dependent Clp protease adaptor protein ClpS